MTERDETWKLVPGYSRYEASDKGRIRTVSRLLPDGTRRGGQVISTRAGNKGYLLADVTDDTGRRRTRTVHRLVLMTFAGPCPEGQESLHGSRGRLVNWWPENLRWGTRGDNERDKARDGTASDVQPTFPCINYSRCGNLVINEGRRCRPCVIEVGKHAADMLNMGMNLQDVAEHFGYTGPDWVYSLARDHGGYSESKAKARTQHPSWSQRVTITVRARRGWQRAG